MSEESCTLQPPSIVAVIIDDDEGYEEAVDNDKVINITTTKLNDGIFLRSRW